MDKKYKSLLLTDDYDSGEPHWQIYEDGSLMFSIGYISPDEKRITKRNNKIYYTKPLYTAVSLGLWHHHAVTYNKDSGTVMQYIDGEEVRREYGDHEQYGLFFLEGDAEYVDGKHGVGTGIPRNHRQCRGIELSYETRHSTVFGAPGISSIRIKSHSRGSH